MGCSRAAECGRRSAWYLIYTDKAAKRLGLARSSLKQPRCAVLEGFSLHANTHLHVFTGLELLRRVASLVPPPRTNLTRFHGIFGHPLPRGVEADAATAPTGPDSCRAPDGRAAWASVALKGLRGLSTDRAHCSGGPCQRPSSAPA
jgi:hypothetical protein